MEILNKKTNLSKVVDMNNDSYSTVELQEIYDFYTEHKDLDVIIDGEVQ